MKSCSKLQAQKFTEINANITLKIMLFCLSYFKESCLPYPGNGIYNSIVYSVVVSYSDTLKNGSKDKNYTKTSLKANSMYLTPIPSWQVG